MSSAREIAIRLLSEETTSAATGPYFPGKSVVKGPKVNMDTFIKQTRRLFPDADLKLLRQALSATARSGS